MAKNNCVRLSKLQLSNFMSFSNVELEFEKFTTFNFNNRPKALENLIEGFKFILNCGDPELNVLQKKIQDDTTIIGDEDITFAEGHIVGLDGITKVFKKTVFASDILYEIDGDPVTAEEYVAHLIDCGIILPSLKTLVVDNLAMGKIAVLTENERSEKIEFFCESRDNITRYNELVDNLANANLELSTLIKNQTKLNTEKRNMKKCMEQQEIRAQLKLEFEVNELEFDLFRLYHNNEFINTVCQKEIDCEKIRLEEAQIKHAGNFEVLGELVGREKHLEDQQKTLDSELKQLIDAYSQNQLEQCLPINKIKYMESQSEILRYIPKIVETFQANIDTTRKELQEMLQATEKEKNMKIQQISDEYRQLQNEFRLKNMPLLFQHDNLKTILNDKYVNLIRESIATWERVAQEKLSELEPINQEIQLLRTKVQPLQVQRQKIKQCEVEIGEIGERLNELTDRIEATITGNVSKTSTQNREKILDELKLRFPDGIYGRLSEFIICLEDGTTSVHQKDLLGCLGQYSEVIIVDTRETAIECIEFLKTKQLFKINEVFLPLNECPEPTESQMVVQGLNLPSNLKYEVIEKLVKVSDENLKKAFLHCIKPTLVCDTMGKTENLIAATRKTINIITDPGSTHFKSSGLIEHTSTSDCETFATEKELSDANFMKFELSRMLQLKKLEWRKEQASLVQLENEISNLERQIENLHDFQAEYEDALKFAQNKLRSFKADLNRLETKPSRQEHMQTLAELDKEIKSLEDEHYQEFSKKVGVANIQEYEEMLKTSSSSKIFPMKILALEESLKRLEEGKTINQMKLLKFSSVDSKKMRAATVELDNLKLKGLTIEAQINVLMVKSNANFKELQKIFEEICKLEPDSEMLMKELCNIKEKISDKMYQLHSAMKENYDILFEGFEQGAKIPLTQGSLDDMIRLPDELPENYKLVENLLQTLTVKFDSLKHSLKTCTDVPKKTRELSLKVKEIQSKLDNIPEMPSNQNNIQMHNDEKLKAIAESTKALNTKIKRLEHELEPVKVERTKKFRECLEIINKEIESFCQLTYNGQIIGSLKVAREIEPYLEEIQYFWRTAENPEQKVSDFGDYSAGIAFLMGIFKCLNQQFVILNDINTNIQFGILQKLFQSQSNMQVILLSKKKMLDSQSSYIARQKSNGLINFQRLY